jgi:hypothetical protein
MRGAGRAGGRQSLQESGRAIGCSASQRLIPITQDMLHRVPAPHQLGQL